MHPHFVDPGPLWIELEREMESAGLRSPLFHSSAWAAHDQTSRHRLITLRDPAGNLLPTTAVQIDRSRVLPTYHLLRVLRFGHGLPSSAWEPTIAALVDLAHSDRRVLRLSIDVFSRENRSEIGSLLARHGFKRSAQPQSYRHTLTVDLRPDPAEILKGMHKTARKNLRAVEKSPLFLRLLTSDLYAGCLAQLQAASMSRTGGKGRSIGWPSILALSRSHPDLSRVVGLFTTETDLTPEALVAFGWGCMHGDHAEYRAAGTIRPANTNLPLSYPLVWNLIQWAREQGSSWFDLGGVSLGDSALDPLAGISDFKRYFSRTVEEVGEEWTLEPSPTRSHLAALLRRAVRGSAQVLGRLSGNTEAQGRLSSSSFAKGCTDA